MGRRQRGIAVQMVLYGILALAVLGAGAGVVYEYTRAIARAETAEAAAKTHKANLDTLTQAHSEQLAENHLMRERQARTDQLLAERQTARTAAQATEKRLDDAINAVLRTRPDVRAWADTAVPVDVVAGLRNPAAGASGAGGKDRAGTAAAQPAGGGRYPGLAREADQR